MPGLTAQLVRSGDAASRKRFAAAQRLMQHAPDYGCVVHMSSDGCMVGHVGYPEYPIAVFRTPAYTLSVEGILLSNGDIPLADDLNALAQALLGAEYAVERSVREWILAHDGDYVIVLATSDGERLCAVTDALGRLPLYFAADDKGLWLGRECKFVVAAKGGVAFDRVGWAEQLWVGYPLGERTLFDGVRRVSGATLLEGRLEPDRVRSNCRALWTLNCEVKDRRPRSVREDAAALVDLFVRRVDRANGAPLVEPCWR